MGGWEMSWVKAKEVEAEKYDVTVARTSILIVFILILIIWVLVSAWAEYSGILRYALFAFGIVAALLFLSYMLFKDVAKSTVTRPEKSEVLLGRSEKLAKLIKRAFQGYPTSQSMLEEELREIMIERISVRRKMPVDEVRERSATFQGAMEIVGDKELARLLSYRKKLGGKKRLMVMPSRSYNERIERIIAKMEEWN